MSKLLENHRDLADTTALAFTPSERPRTERNDPRGQMA
jgi:hypothetical protein